MQEIGLRTQSKIREKILLWEGNAMIIQNQKKIWKSKYKKNYEFRKRYERKKKQGKNVFNKVEKLHQ